MANSYGNASEWSISQYLASSQHATTQSLQASSRSSTVFQGNILFWTSDDPRETAILGEESTADGQGAVVKRPVEYTITTPQGYSVQTKTFIQSQRGDGRAEFWWATLTQLGLCTYKDIQIPMARFLQPGTTVESSRFFLPEDGRCFEWRRGSLQRQTFALFEVPSGKVYAEYIAGPFESPELHPYMQYYWAKDDTLLLFAILAITIRRWTDIYNF